MRAAFGKAFREEFEAAGNAGKEVVEVVRDAAGELSYGFHFLRLPERVLRLHEFAGALFDSVFEDRRCFLLIVYVGVGADPFNDRAALVLDWSGAGEVPSIGAVFAPKPKLRLVRLAGVKRAKPAGLRVGNIVGVHDVGPFDAIERAGCCAAISVNAFVEPIEQAIWIGGPGLVRHGPRKRAEALFALAHRGFGFAAGGMVLEKHRDLAA